MIEQPAPRTRSAPPVRRILAFLSSVMASLAFTLTISITQPALAAAGAVRVLEVLVVTALALLMRFRPPQALALMVAPAVIVWVLGGVCVKFPTTCSVVPKYPAVSAYRL